MLRILNIAQAVEPDVDQIEDVLLEARTSKADTEMEIFEN